MPDNYSFD